MMTGLSEAERYLANALSRAGSAHDRWSVILVAQHLHAGESNHMHYLGAEAEYFGACNYCLLRAGRALRATDELAYSEEARRRAAEQGVPALPVQYKLGDVADIVFAGGTRRATYIPDYRLSGTSREGAWVWPEGYAVASHVNKVTLVKKEGTDD